MTVRQAVTEGAKRLSETAETPFLDAVLLLSSAAGKSKEQILASYPEPLGDDVAVRYDAFLTLRLEGNPVSYIRGKKEFYGLEFEVGPGVLVPRPETETLVDAAFSLVNDIPSIRRVHDCCTGSGCVAITLKHKIPDLDISASDLSEQALAYFSKNCRALLSRELPLYKSDLLAGVTGDFDVIVANPPYLTSGAYRKMQENGWPEPELALDGGEDGLSSFRKLIPMSTSRLNRGGYLLLEAEPSLFPAIEKLLVQNNFHTTIIYKDLSGRDRVVCGGPLTGGTWKT
jgi:release factor glutamine methyltransferase